MAINPRKLIIIGSGPAGLTAAIYASRANLSPLIIEGAAPGGQLMGTSTVENWPGEKSILGPKLMMHMRDQARALGTEFISESVASVDFKKSPFVLRTDRNKEFLAHTVIVATGATPKKLGVPGEDTYWGKGITTCAVCDATFYKDKKVVVIGGGDTAMEEASFLRKFTSDITIIQIMDSLTASHAMQQRVITDPAIKIIYSSTVTKFDGNGQHVKEISFKNNKTGKVETRTIDGVFIAIGLQPNTKPFEGQLALDKWGYVTVTTQTSTSIKGVFAAGDVHDYRYRQAITSAGWGCMAALDAERYLKELGK